MRWFQSGFWPLFVAILCCLSRLASHISWTGHFHLLALLHCMGNISRVSDNCSGHLMGCGKPQPPLPLPDKTILRGLFWLLWLLQHWSCWELPGWSSPRAIVGVCTPSFSLVCTLPALSSSGLPCLGAAELWAGQKGCPIPCCPPACAEHQALLAAVLGGTARLLTKSALRQSAAFCRGVKGASEFAPDDTGKSFLGCWVAF